MADQKVSEINSIIPNLLTDTTEAESLQHELPVDNSPLKTDNVVSEKSALGNELGIKTEEWTKEDELEEQLELAKIEKQSPMKEDKNKKADPGASMTLVELNKMQTEAGLPLTVPQPIKANTNIEKPIMAKIDDAQLIRIPPKPEPLPIMKPGEFPTIVNQPTIKTPKSENRGGFLSRILGKKS